LPDQPPEVVVTNSSVRIVFNVSRLPGPEAVISINSAVSNNTPNPISDLTFQIAVMKVNPHLQITKLYQLDSLTNRSYRATH